MISDFVRLAPIVPRPACVPHHFYRVPHGVLHASCMGTAWVLQGGRPASGLPLERDACASPLLGQGIGRPEVPHPTVHIAACFQAAKSGQTSGLLVCFSFQ